jgi:hypothetical protein
VGADKGRRCLGGAAGFALVSHVDGDVGQHYLYYRVLRS